MQSSALDLIERDAQLAALRACAADAGAGRVVLVSGEAGIGKTSLVSAFVADHPDHAVWWGACDALLTPNPLAPLHDIARSRDVAFAPLLQQGVAAAVLFSEVLRDLQAAGPAIVVIDDAHWADQSTLDLILFLGRRLDRTRAVLVVTFREDEVSLAHPLRAVMGELPAAITTRIELNRLSEEGVSTLARRALRSPAGVHAASGGNPFFVTELLRHGSTEPPQSVQDLVLGRCARLGASAREIVQLAAIVPARIERWLVDAILQPNAADLDACLDSGLLLVQDEWLHFRHELARVAVEQAMSPVLAEHLHGCVLAELRTCGKPTANPTRLVHHAVRARARDAVLELAPAAARDARARGARRQAAAHYRTTLQFSDYLPPLEREALLEAYAVECQATHQLGEAIAARENIARLTADRGDALAQARNGSQLAVDYVVALRNADADASSRRAIALLEAMPPGRELANAYRVEAQLRMLNRDCAQSVAWGEKAIALAVGFEDQEVLAAALSTVGAALIFIDYDAGVRKLERALEIALDRGFDYIAANTYSNLGSASGEVFRLEAAEKHLEQAIAFSTRKEVDFYRTYATAWMALCDLHCGRWEEAEVHALEALACAPESSTGRVTALCALGRLRARKGDAGVEPLLDEALELALASGTLQRLAPVRAARAEAAFLRGDHARVVQEASSALALAREKSHGWYVGELSYWLWREGVCDTSPRECALSYALAIGGEWKQAAAEWERIGCPYEQARALSEGDDAAKLQALAIFERLGARPALEAQRRILRECGVRGVPRGPRASTQRNPHGLTARELEILELLCEGLRNSEIAERLYRSVRTVEHHVDSILGKLGARSRGEVATLARGAGLVGKMGTNRAQNA